MVGDQLAGVERFKQVGGFVQFAGIGLAFGQVYGGRYYF